MAFFGKGFREVDVFDGLKLAPGNVVVGPAIVEQPTTTIIVTAAFDLTCDRYCNYLLNSKTPTPGEARSGAMTKELAQ
jgi:N-methylhydantoinase A